MKDRLTSTLVKQRVNIDVVAKALSKSQRTIRRLAAAGRIPGARKLLGQWSFDPDRINAMFAKAR